MPRKVIFSERAFTALLTETNEKITTETGGVFLGVAQRDIWYVIETIDPGPDSIFKTDYFEYDKKYINHLANKINKLYSNKLCVLGLWHRHPGSLDRFTNTDDDTNKRFANENYGVTISAIVNIDPKFRLTLYSVTLKPLVHTKISYEINNHAIPRDIKETTSFKNIEGLINSHSFHNSTLNLKKYPPQCSIDFTQGEKVYDMIFRFVKKRMNPITDVDNIIFKNNDSDFEKIVCSLYDVMIFCEQKKIPVTIEKGNHNAVNLSFGKTNAQFKIIFFAIDFSDKPAYIPNNSVWGNIRRFFLPYQETVIIGKHICFIFNNRLYPYNVGMFKSAWEEYIK